MTATKFWPAKVLLAKVESSYGTDPTPTGVANAILARNVSIKPMEGTDVNRDLEQQYMGNQEQFPVGLNVQLSFETEIAGSGVAGTAPKWGVLARACGCAETIVASTSVTYTPITLNHESATFYLWIDGTKQIITGARGTAKATINAEGVPVLQWTFTGLFGSPAEVANAAPTLTGFTTPLIATTVNTPTFALNSVALVMRSYSFDLGCKVEPRFLLGRDEIRITGRNEKIDIVVEATPISTLDPFTLAKNRTKAPLTIVHGTVAGNICTISAPTSQVMRPSDYQNNQSVMEWPLSLMPIPSAAGNDQFSIALT